MPRRAHENTLPSFAAALAAGASGIELDVHATVDDVVIVHHDPAVRGLEIRRSRWSDIAGIQLAPDVGIPTLDEVCALVHGVAELFVEIKGAGIERLVVDVLAGYDGAASIHSFDHALIARTARLDPTRRVGLLFEDEITDPSGAMRAAGARDLWPHHTLVTEALVAAAHAIGGRVIPWTVNDDSVARRLAGWGVDGLCTDDVSLLPRT